jgi:hypothetical protein
LGLFWGRFFFFFFFFFFAPKSVCSEIFSKPVQHFFSRYLLDTFSIPTKIIIFFFFSEGRYSIKCRKCKFSAKTDAIMEPSPAPISHLCLSPIQPHHRQIFIFSIKFFLFFPYQIFFPLPTFPKFFFPFPLFPYKQIFFSSNNNFYKRIFFSSSFSHFDFFNRRFFFFLLPVSVIFFFHQVHIGKFFCFFFPSPNIISPHGKLVSDFLSRYIRGILDAGFFFFFFFRSHPVCSEIFSLFRSHPVCSEIFSPMSKRFSTFFLDTFSIPIFFFFFFFCTQLHSEMCHFFFHPTNQ